MCQRHRGNLPAKTNEKTAFSPFAGKAEAERPRNFKHIIYLFILFIYLFIEDGNASMPEQVKRPNPWRKKMMIYSFMQICDTLLTQFATLC
jgi:hypothetical protein